MRDNNSYASSVEAASEDEGDWEEVAVPTLTGDEAAAATYNPYAEIPTPLDTTNTATKPLEITIGAKDEAITSRPKGISHAERLLRIDCHKTHTVCLLASARIRNKWLNDKLLHARLMSLTPMSLQNGFAMITKSRVPEAGKRGRLFEAALQRLVDWWIGFFDVLPEGHLRNRTFDEVHAETMAREKASRRPKNSKKGKEKAVDSESDDDYLGEILKSEKSLMKHALQQQGSRDVSAHLFTALCRALGIPARLVVSLQSVPWQSSIGKPKSPTKKGKKKAPTTADDHTGDIGGPSRQGGTVPSKSRTIKTAFPGGGQRLDGGDSDASLVHEAPSHIKLRKSRPAGRTLGSPSRISREIPADPLTTPPVFWTEVFSRADGKWVPVDPIRAIVNKRKLFDPAEKPQTGPGPRFKKENRMVYVIALEEDGYGRDVTPRYAKEYGAKVAKLQQGGSNKNRKEWWDRITAMIRRPYQLARDDIEDDELQENQLTEAMPTTVSGFKDHPLYALERHLRRDEVIQPLKEIGKFRGESVYPRANVIPLKSAENWMRVGRKVKAGCQPMKQVKLRAATINKQREIELAMADDDTGAGIMQGLYALTQTELYRPDPIKDGKVPKNDFGNIDLYVDSMLPPGGTHLPYKGIAKIARKLGFDFAEAVTGFEFRKRKANPILTGIVIAAENASAVLEAYWEAEQEAAQRESEKRQDRVIKRWTRLVQGLRIRQRLQAQYASNMPKETTVTVQVEAEDHSNEGGGFLVAADDVVQPFHLPRYQHMQVDEPASPASIDRNGNTSLTSATSEVSREVLGLVLDDDEDDVEADNAIMDGVVEMADGGELELNAPKSMLELAIRSRPIPRAPSPLILESSPITPAPTTIVTGRITHSTRIKPAEAAASKVTSNRTSNRKRTRAAKESEDSDLSDASVEIVQPSRTRRPTARPVAVPSEKRSLRPRKGKTAAQVQEEEEREQRYREAADMSE